MAARWKGVTCDEPGCPNPVHCKGKCNSHYWQTFGKAFLAERRKKPCRVCGAPMRTRGLCQPHYKRFLRGLPLEVKPRICREPDCDRPARSRDWCRKHYEANFLRFSPTHLARKRLKDQQRRERLKKENTKEEDKAA